MSSGSKFWVDYQPGFRYSEQAPGSTAFFEDVEEHRYRTEPAILELVDFSRWNDKDVLELGCGIATDGANFARHGARYTAVDQSTTAVDIARGRFQHAGLDGEILHGDVTNLPIPDSSQDFVYSNGVIHHTHGTERAVKEAARVLRPGGEALVMVYHRSSVNYHVNIMLLRRALAALLLIPGVAGRSEITRGHRDLLREHGWRYLTDRELFLSNNTDGPGNPLSKVYTARQAELMFRDAGFATVQTTTRFLNLRLYPGGERLARSRPARWLERRYGWHLWVRATL